MSKKKISITINGNETKIKASDMTLEEIKDFFLSSGSAKTVDDDDYYDDDDDDYDDDDDDDDYDDDDYDDDDDDDENSVIRYMDTIMKESLDIVENVGYSNVAKIVTFNHMGMKTYGIEINRPVNGITRLAEYSLEIDEVTGNRAVVSEGNGTLIVLCPIFTKPVTERIPLSNYYYTGAVVSCQPGEDTVKGVNALVEILKTMI